SGAPATLQLADTTTGTADVIESNIGRGLAIRPGTQTLTFVSKPRTGPWTIKGLDLKTRVITTIVETIPNSEDYAWDAISTGDGRLYMASGAKVFAWWPQITGWLEVVDLTPHGLAKISRLAISPDRAA